MPNMPNERCVAFFTNNPLFILANTEAHIDIEGSKLPPEYYFQVAKLDPDICTVYKKSITAEQIKEFKKSFSDKLKKKKCKAGDLPRFLGSGNSDGIEINTTKWHEKRAKRGSRAQEAMAEAYVKEIESCRTDIEEGNFDKLPDNFKILLALRINKILPMEFSHREDETTWSSACSKGRTLKFGTREKGGGDGQDAGMLAALTDSIINISSNLAKLKEAAEEYYTTNLAGRIVLDDPRFASEKLENHSIKGDFASHGIEVEKYRKLFAKEFTLGLSNIGLSNIREGLVLTPEWNIDPQEATKNSSNRINKYRGKGGFSIYKDVFNKAASDLYKRNANFDINQDWLTGQDKRSAEESQKKELLAAAYRFIAFEYNGNENNKLDLEKIHSSFISKDAQTVIMNAKAVVCGGQFDKAKFDAAKKESIYSGVDKFKATINNEGFLVIHSVGDTIDDAHFKGGVVTKFKFPIPESGVNGLPREITKDNLHELFTDGSDAKDSGLSLLGAIELAFGALREIEKDNDGQLIAPKSSQQFNAIFPGYGVRQRVEDFLDLGAATPAEPAEPAPAPPLPPPEAGGATPAPEGAPPAEASEAAEATPEEEKPEKPSPSPSPTTSAKMLVGVDCYYI